MSISVIAKMTGMIHACIESSCLSDFVVDIALVVLCTVGAPIEFLLHRSFLKQPDVTYVWCYGRRGFWMNRLFGFTFPLFKRLLESLSSVSRRRFSLWHLALASLS